MFSISIPASRRGLNRTRTWTILLHPPCVMSLVMGQAEQNIPGRVTAVMASLQCPLSLSTSASRHLACILHTCPHTPVPTHLSPHTYPYTPVSTHLSPPVLTHLSPHTCFYIPVPTHLSLHTCPYTLVPTHLSPHNCLYTLVSTHLSPHTCLHTPVSTHLSPHTCPHTPVLTYQCIYVMTPFSSAPALPSLPVWPAQPAWYFSQGPGLPWVSHTLCKPLCWHLTLCLCQVSECPAVSTSMCKHSSFPSPPSRFDLRLGENPSS